MTPSSDGFATAMQMELVSASSSEVVVEWTVADCHRQPFGIVHGGTYCGAIESVCSIGAVLSARERDPGATAVGLENHTTFVRAVREGKLRAVATPITRGRRTQVWQADVRSEDGRLVATGRVRLLVLPAGESTAPRE